MKRFAKILMAILVCVVTITAVACETSHTHKYSDWVIATDPTMETVGTLTRSCPCGHEETMEVAALSDTSVWTVKSTVAATCTAVGAVTYTSIYGDVTVVVAPTGHTFSDWAMTTEPTLEEVGVLTRTCECGETETKDLAVLTDTSVWTVKSTVPATCTAAGSATYTSVYGDVTVVVAATGHTFSDWAMTTEPTLEAVGVLTRTCECGETETKDLAVLTDTSVWTVKSTVPATCTVAGSVTYTSVYGDVTVATPVVGHSYAEWTLTVDPTMDEAGTATHVCETCGDVETVTVAALSDASVWTVLGEVAPTYNGKGSKTYTSVYGTVVVDVAKLVAPYDSKTYYNFAVDMDADDGVSFVNGVATIETAWSTASVTLDEFGIGFGTAYPFRGFAEFSMVDAATGKFQYVLTGFTTTEDGENIPNPDKVDTVFGYVDFATGVMIYPRNASYNYVMVLVPEAINDSAKASAWDNAMAIEYTFADGTKATIFIFNGVVYFGVSFEDAEGIALDANACVDSDYVVVKNASGEVVERFVHNGTKLVVSDKVEGSYVNGENTLVLSGYGVASYLGEEGTYTKVSDTTVDLYVGGAYYFVELSGNSFTATKVMVTVTFNTDGKAEVEAVSVNKNISYVLPIPTNAQYTFKGWYLDSNFETPVAEDFVPTLDVELFALWKEKVIVNLVGVLEGDASVLYLGEGDVIGAALPSYTIDMVGMKKFIGWYLDESFETELPEEVEVTPENSNIYVYAKWMDLPAYYGTYYGPEVWGASSGNSSSKTLTIDENGNMTGFKTGTIESYDPETQLVTWMSGSSVYKFWFDSTAGIIAGLYNNNEMGTDMYVLTKAGTSGQLLTAQYAVNCPKEEGSTTTGYYARFVTVVTLDGEKSIFLFRNHIYSNVVIKDSLGNALAVADVKNSKSVCVYDAETNAYMFGVASQGDSFNANYKTNVLDAYFGSYTCGDSTVVLDGTGVVVFGDKTGTYAKTLEEASYGFDVYLADSTEYYQLTLNGTTATMVKPMVTISFETGEGHNAVASISVNMNVGTNLPAVVEEGYVFNGWFLEDSYETQVVDGYKPTENVVLYAKFSAPAVLTITYNNGVEDEAITYSVGDVVEIVNPTYKKHAFKGWFTTEDFQEGTEWTSGGEILVNTHIYAKWEVAPVYNNVYSPIEIYGTNTNGSKSSAYARSTAVLDISPEGIAPKTSYPFSGGENVVQNYNPETGYLEILSGTMLYKGYVDKVSGIIVVTYRYTAQAVLGEVDLLTPFETNPSTSRISSSYWNSGLTRCIEYTFEENVYRMFVMNNMVYFGVTFTDMDGNAVLGANCYNVATLFVKDANGDVIAKCGFDGTTMQVLDGYEGSYAEGENTVVLNGVHTISITDSTGTKTGTYTLVEGKEFTADVYVENTYLEATIDKVAGTVSFNKPMVNVTFNGMEKAESTSVSVNKNIVVELPVLSNDGFKFRGWFSDQDCTTAITEFVPTEDVEIYAGWDAFVTITLVKNNDLESETVTGYAVGDTYVAPALVFTNGVAFAGWYTEPACETLYVPAALSGNLNLYAKWIEASPFFGSYTGINSYGTKDNGSVSAGKSLAVDADGNAKGCVTGKIENYDPTTGYFEVVNGTDVRVGSYDAVNGVLVVNYGTGTPSLKSDVYVLVKNSTSSVQPTENGTKCCSVWNSGLTRVLQLNIVIDGTSSSILVAIHANKIYGNVSFSDSSITCVNAVSSHGFSILDCNGNVIVTIE